MIPILESVIVIVGCVLLATLILATGEWIWPAHPTFVEFLDFSLRVTTVGHGLAYVTYRDNRKCLDFEARVGRRPKSHVDQLDLAVPKETPDEVICEVVPKLASGLAKLRYEYTVYRLGEPQPIPDEERAAAVATLREMGIEIVEIGRDRMQIKKAPTPYWRRIVGSPRKATTEQWLRLLSIARGTQVHAEVLAKSDSGQRSTHPRA